jgi:uncharacterized membrane protein YecN with MAPEG domain
MMTRRSALDVASYEPYAHHRTLRLPPRPAIYCSVSPRHSNFAEYVPMSLLMMALAESTDVHAWLLHGTGIALIIARLSHAFGVSQTPENFNFRVTGMALTFTVLGMLAVACLWQQLR